MLLIRPSRAPIIAKCPQAAYPPRTEVETSSDASRMGDAVHEWLATRIPNGSLAGDIMELAERFDVESESFAAICFQCWQWWQENRQHFPDPETEVGMSWRDDLRDIILAGTADLISWGGDSRRIRGCDWKSGWLDGDVEPQIRCYAKLALENSDADEVYYVVPRPRLNAVDAWTWPRAEMDVWWEKFAARIEGAAAYSPGGHCGYCPRFEECPALAQRAAMTKGWFLDFQSVADAVGAMTEHEAFQAEETIKLLRRGLDLAHDFIRARAKRSGGKIVGPDGWELRIEESKKREIKPREAWPILLDSLGAARILEAVKVSKTIAEQIIKDATPRGKKGTPGKGAAAAAFVQRLEDAGALQITFQETLQLRRTDGRSATTERIGVDAVPQP